MLVPLTHFVWQLLRAALRAELAGQPPLTGRELRVNPTRHSKDGTFLDRLVDDGLLAAAGKPEPATGPQPQPPQFRTRYRLTDLGRHAAEYGEFERGPSPPPPVAKRPAAGARRSDPDRPQPRFRRRGS